MRRDSKIWSAGVGFLVAGLIAGACGQLGLAFMLLLAPLLIRAFNPVRRRSRSRVPFQIGRGVRLLILGVGLVASCFAPFVQAQAHYILQPTPKPCVQRPSFTVSKVFEADANGKKRRGDKPIAIIETNEITGVSKVFEADERGRKPYNSKPVKIIFRNNSTGISKIYETDMRGRKPQGAKPEAIIQTNSGTGVSRLYETDASGRKPYGAKPDAIIQSNGLGVSRFYDTDGLGKRSYRDKPLLIIETR